MSEIIRMSQLQNINNPEDFDNEYTEVGYVE